MHDLRIGGNVCSLIKIFLSERIFSICIDAFKHDDFISPVCLPQGPVPSDVLSYSCVHGMCFNTVRKTSGMQVISSLLTVGKKTTSARNEIQDVSE